MAGLQNLFSFTLTILAYASFAVFVFGVFYKIYVFKKTPVPLKIPTTPQSINVSGVAVRMTGDVLFFKGLSKGETETALWTASWFFHLGFFLVILRHLRYFTNPIPSWVMLVQDLGIFAGIVMFFAVLALFFRRYTNERVKYITTFADLTILVIIFLIVATGLIMKYVVRPDIVEVKAYIFSLIFLHPSKAPTNPVFVLHFVSVAALLIYFPFSKLIHAVGYFLSPTRNQANNPRTKRHVNPWADEAWDKMVNGPRPVDSQTNEPYQPWSQEQWRKRWLKQEN